MNLPREIWKRIAALSLLFGCAMLVLEAIAYILFVLGGRPSGIGLLEYPAIIVLYICGRNYENVHPLIVFFLNAIILVIPFVFIWEIIIEGCLKLRRGLEVRTWKRSFLFGFICGCFIFIFEELLYHGPGEMLLILFWYLMFPLSLIERLPGIGKLFAVSIHLAMAVNAVIYALPFSLICKGIFEEGRRDLPEVSNRQQQ